MEEQNQRQPASQPDNTEKSAFKAFSLTAIIIVGLSWLILGLINLILLEIVIYNISIFPGIIVVVYIFLLMFILKKYKKKFQSQSKGNLYFYLLNILIILIAPAYYLLISYQASYW